MNRKRWPWACGLIFSLLALCGCKDRFFDNPFDPNAEARAYEILAIIQLNGIIPVDLAFAGDSLWVVDINSRLLSLNYNSGEVIRQLDIGLAASGVAYDGDGLWLSQHNSFLIVKVNLINGAVIRTLALGRGDFGPLDYYGSRLYIADRLSNTLLVVDPETGNIEQVIASPGFSLNGVAFDGSQLWTLDALQQRIYRLNASGTVQNIYQTPGRAGAGLSFAAGICWSGDQSGTIYKLRFQ